MKKKKLSKALIDFNDKSIHDLIATQQQVLDQNVRMLENGKTISISQLPDSRHKTRLLNLVMNAEQSKVVVVALANSDNTWQAYIGYPDIRDLRPIVDDYTDVAWCCENIRDRTQVLMMGDKLDRETAIVLFPEWGNKVYKENSSKEKV